VLQMNPCARPRCAFQPSAGRPGEVVDIDQAGRFGAVTQDLADVVEVPDAGLPSRMSDTQLEQNADERAAVVVLMFLEPVVKHIENRQQLFLGRVTAQP